MKNPPTIDDLQGEWRLVSVGQNGGKAPFFLPWIIKMRMTIEGDRFTKHMGGNVFETGRLTLAQNGEYSHLDEHIDSGDDSGKVHLGIVRWVGKKVELLQGKIGEDRPSGFPYTKTARPVTA
ncbi:hypothetical protein [Rhodopirellula baltica]|nr:hypothetical protein [Rhodopirellula baltica]